MKTIKIKHYLLTFVLKLSLFAFAIFMIPSCGNDTNNRSASEVQDSILKADSISKMIMEVESWDLLKLALENEEGFMNKYGNKKLRIKNLVVDDILKGGFVLQCLAFSPEDSLLSNTSQKGDVTKNVAEHRDYVNDTICKVNSDFSYFFELKLKEQVSTADVKVKKVEAEKLSKKSYFYSVIEAEGESIVFKENTFSLNNCSIIAE